MIARLATIFRDLSWIFSRDRVIRKPTSFLYAYIRFRIKKRLHSSSQYEEFLGLKIHFPDYQMFYALWHEIFLQEIYLTPPSWNGQALNILDAGSNIGMSILFFKYVYPEAKITGFEVSDTTLQWLKKNIAVNHLRNVRIVQAGLAARSGTTKFFDCGDGSGSSNIVPGFHSDIAQKTKEVRVETLSSFLKEEVDLLKIDIEGSEFDVLQEAGPTLRRVKYIIIEVHQVLGEKNDRISELLQTLDTNGFRYGIVYTAITHRDFAKSPMGRYNIVVSATRI